MPIRKTSTGEVLTSTPADDSLRREAAKQDWDAQDEQELREENVDADEQD